MKSVTIDPKRIAALVEQVRQAPGVLDCCKGNNALLVFVDTEDQSRYLGICREKGHKHVRAFPAPADINRKP